MAKMMLIGDSIRLHYQAKVTELLGGRATVTGPEDNGRFSAYTLFCLQRWVPDDDYDVIQWNNGQWDVCYMADGRIHTPLGNYCELQERIATVLQPKTKRLVFATTTPVWPEQFAKSEMNPRQNVDIDTYNRAVTEMLVKRGVEINDLNALLAQDVKRFVSADMVHLSEAGNDACARHVAALVGG